jgi:hypothetical protein
MRDYNLDQDIEKIQSKTLKYAVKATLQTISHYPSLTDQQDISQTVSNYYLHIWKNLIAKKVNKRVSTSRALVNFGDILIGTLGAFYIMSAGVFRKLAKAIINSFSSVSLKSQASIFDGFLYLLKFTFRLGKSFIMFPSSILTIICFSPISPCTTLFNLYKDKAIQQEVSTRKDKAIRDFSQTPNIEDDILCLYKKLQSIQLSESTLQFILKNFNLFFYSSKELLCSESSKNKEFLFKVQKQNKQLYTILQLFQDITSHRGGSTTSNDIFTLSARQIEDKFAKKTALESQSLTNTIKRFVVSRSYNVLGWTYFAPSPEETEVSSKTKQTMKLHKAIAEYISL